MLFLTFILLVFFYLLSSLIGPKVFEVLESFWLKSDLWLFGFRVFYFNILIADLGDFGGPSTAENL